MAQYIDKDALVAEIDRQKIGYNVDGKHSVEYDTTRKILNIIDTLEVKGVDLMLHTIISECCDWLAMNTNLSHHVIEGCRNLMLTVKEEQLKAQKGE